MEERTVVGLGMGASRLHPGTSRLELCGFGLLVFIHLNVNLLVCNVRKYPRVLSLLCKTARKRVDTV